MNLQELKEFGLNPADWLVSSLRSAKHLVLFHKKDPDFRILVELQELSTRIESVKVPQRTYIC